MREEEAVGRLTGDDRANPQLATPGAGASAPDDGRLWPWWRRYALRFGTLFILLSNLPSPFYVMPGGARSLHWLSRLWDTVVPPLAMYLLHRPGVFLRNPSDDQTFQFVRLGVWIVVALAGGALWLAWDRRTARDAGLWRLLYAYVRAVMVVALLKYGLAKMLRAQFPDPSLEQLVGTYGGSSPMELAYIFMGASPGATRLAGTLEVVSGVLIAFRRTLLAGALLAIVVLSGVVAFDLFYEVPARLVALQYLSLGLLLMSPHARRIADLLRNRPVFPAPPSPLLSDPRWPLWRAGLAATAVTLLLLTTVRGDLLRLRTVGIRASRSPLYGIWNVDAFDVDGAVRPSGVADGKRWRRLVCDSADRLSIYDEDDTRHRYDAVFDPGSGSIQLTGREPDRGLYRLAYRRPSRDTLIVTGVVDGHQLSAVCHRAAPRRFLLTSGRFRWVVESPIF